MPKIDMSIIGRTFGKLIVINLNKKQDRMTYWECKCECGNDRIVSRDSLIQGDVKSCLSCSRNKKKKGEAAFNEYYSTYRKRAELKNIFFSLSKEEFKSLIYKNCYYCNYGPLRQFPCEKILQKKRVNGPIFVNGVDRIDPHPSIGYVYYNCVPCCALCNRAKSDLSSEEFYDWINRLIAHNKPE